MGHLLPFFISFSIIAPVICAPLATWKGPLSSTSDINLGPNYGAVFRPLESNKVVFRQHGYVAHSVSKITLRLDYAVYASINFMKSQSSLFTKEHYKVLIDRSQTREGWHLNDKLDNLPKAMISHKLAEMVSYF
jgi:hypothetical protein